MAKINKNLISRAIQKRDKTRIALRKSACGAIMIDGFTFSVSVESDGAASNKGVVFTLSGEAVENELLNIDMLDVTYPTTGGIKTIKRKPELYKKKDGRSIYRCVFSEIKIPQCAEPDSLMPTATTEEQLFKDTGNQIIFRFTPRYSSNHEQEIMINIYPTANPIDGSCTEWVMATSDREFFEHGGLAKIHKIKK